MQDLLTGLNALLHKDTAANWISLVAWIVGLLTFIFTILTFQRQNKRQRRIELQENYLKLELESNAVFRFEAEHGGILADYKLSVRPDDYGAGVEPADLLKRESVADNFFLQQLNLFEIAARFRRDEVFAPHIFGSWVIWFHDVTRSWWFRERWESEYSDNYTEDLYYIFTPMVAYFNEMVACEAISDRDDDPHAGALKKIFFEHVAERFRCPVVLEWLKRGGTVARPALTRWLQPVFRPIPRLIWRTRAYFRDSRLRSTKAAAYLATVKARHKRDRADALSSPATMPNVRPAPDATIAWTASPAERADAARFFARTVGLDTAYISHGEMQMGLSLDGKTWAPDLEVRFLEDVAKKDDNRNIAVARNNRGIIVAAAIVYWEQTDRASFGVLEDLAVEPPLRSAGLGARMSDFIDAEAKKRGCRWLFLESGKDNTGAHAFFARQGYDEISRVLAKSL